MSHTLLFLYRHSSKVAQSWSSFQNPVKQIIAQNLTKKLWWDEASTATQISYKRALSKLYTCSFSWTKMKKPISKTKILSVNTLGQSHFRRSFESHQLPQTNNQLPWSNCVWPSYEISKENLDKCTYTYLLYTMAMRNAL